MSQLASEARANDCGRRLRIGLLVDRLATSRYVYEFVTWVQSHPRIAATYVLLDDRSSDAVVPAVGRGRGLYAGLSKLAWIALTRFEQTLIGRDRHHSAHMQALDLRILVEDVLRIRADELDGRPCPRFDPVDIAKVKGLQLDLVVQLSGLRVCGEILSASRFGVISLSCGQLPLIGGGIAGFWEVHDRCATTPVNICRLTEDGGADVLFAGHFSTRHYFLLNQAFVLRKAFCHLRILIEKIAAAEELPRPLPKFPNSSKRRTVSPSAILRYSANRLRDMIRKRLRRIVGVDNRWCVAYVRGNWRSAELSKGVALENRPHHYLADPFLLRRDGRTYCFLEDLDYSDRRGRIDVYELTDAGGRRLGTALDEPFHLSFPFIFWYDGELYMCPESSANRDVRLYKCTEFPQQWRLAKVIMQNVSAVDTMLVEHEGKWWMLTNIDPASIGDHCSELHVFSADSPLDVDWRSHPQNPVMVDAMRARNAGLLVDGKALFRVSQQQDFDFYGRATSINQIIVLNEDRYQETCVSEIMPSFGRGVMGIHHMHSNGELTAFDFAVSSRVGTSLRSPMALTPHCGCREVVR